jgi:phospholipase/carboxylesterase
MVMNSWYDIQDLANNTLNPDALESADRISRVMTEEAKSTDNLFIGGFSQGGAMALVVGYSQYEGKCKGVIGLSCYTFELKIDEGRMRIPALLCHGEEDEMVAINYARITYHHSLAGVDYQFRKYPGLPHSLDDQEMVDVKVWMEEQMAPKNKL